jgi:hypothetical protein
VNIFIVGEGEIGEKRVYGAWVQKANPALTEVPMISDIVENNYSIFSGGGQPYFIEAARAAIVDVNTHGNINRLVLAADSEEQTYQEKYDEIENGISNLACIADIHIVVQHFCLETWALGNRKLGPRNPRNPKLLRFKKIYDVLTSDPELLPDCPEFGYTRAKFALKYLQLLLNDQNPSITYSKSNPKFVCHPTFFEQVRKRHHATTHIASFAHFLKAVT